MSQLKMKDYGLKDEVQTEAAGYTVGRILSQAREVYRVVCEKGEMLSEISGKLRYEAVSGLDFPAVGDFVLLDRDSDKSGHAIIQKILPRKSVFVRKAAGNAMEEQVVAANIDTLFLCMSLNQDFNLRRLERYLTLAWESGAVPVVVLTKADLCENIAEKLSAVQEIAMGQDVLVTSSVAENGCEEILEYLQPKRTVAFIGSSGVGKSTLVNRLLGKDRQCTREIREDDKGRHATTRRELILVPGRGLVIDTPGMRELGMWDVSEGLEQSFLDVEQFFGKCRFRNCTHTSEPGCAVCEAIAAGNLSEKRWKSYCKLKAEAVFMDDKAGYLAEKEKRYKDISKMVRVMYKKK